MCINEKDFEELKGYSIPTVQIEIRLGDIRKGDRKATAFVLKTKAFRKLAEDSGRQEYLNAAIEEACRKLTEAVKEVVNG